MQDDTAAGWFLGWDEEGHRDSRIHAGDRPGPWSEGNLVTPLVHGAVYYARLLAELSALRSGDRVWFTDWRGDADEKLTPDGPTIGDLLADLARRGVEVRGLVWRSHGERITSPISGRSNELLGRRVNAAGGEVLLDQRVRLFGSHHQKMVVLRRRNDAAKDVAFVGGIDLCHSRRDDAAHEGDPQALEMDSRYGDRPPWHDATLELRGPVVADLLAVFSERWDDPTPLDKNTPYRILLQKLARMPRHPKPLPEAAPPPPPAGPHAVQLLRTYGVKHPPFPFAPDGERSVARAYAKAFAAAKHLIYLEDQYLWSREVASGIAEALRRSPQLQVIAVVPRHPDADGRVTGPPFRIGQLRSLRLLQRAAPGRVGVFDIENRAGTPVYVHAKVCIVDDAWATCGSDNFNLRSWTTDSELTCAVFDTSAPLDGSDAPAAAAPRQFARDLRLELWAEHLGLDRDDPRLRDRARGLDLWRERAAALDGWHREPRGEHPGARVRHHTPERVTRLQWLYAAPVYRIGVDPDGRPRALRGTDRF